MNKFKKMIKEKRCPEDIGLINKANPTCKWDFTSYCKSCRQAAIKFHIDCLKIEQELKENKLCPSKKGLKNEFYPDCEYNVHVNCDLCREESIKKYKKGYLKIKGGD